MMPLASIEALSPSKLLFAYAIVAAAGRFLDFLVVCISIMIPLASIQPVLKFKLLLAMQSLLQLVGF